jgi:hypothetical protein
MTLCLMRPVALSATISSGLTRPLTSASPSPQVALITISSAAPVSGLTVKQTPAAVAGAISCTTTARLTCAGGMPWRAR